MMKYLPLLLASIAPLSLHANEQATFHDKVEFDEAGSRVVLRTAQWPSLARGMVEVEQRLQVNEVGNLKYDYHTQSEATKEFHSSYCAEIGFDPFDGEVSFTPEAGGWHCIKDEVDPGAMPVEQAEAPSAMHDRSVDFVTARAPTGSARVGVNFPATGYITYRSSQGGSMQGNVHVDHRCRFYVSKHYNGPFSGNQVAGVSCLAHEPRFLTTGMEGCIPRLCGSDRGTISVR